jgi:hypothetical protein
VTDHIVEDTKQKFRLTSIEEEGNDPAKPAQQINPGDIGGEGGPGELEGGPEGGPGGLKERTEPHHSDEDQTGRKDASQHPFGEDPRGALEIQSKPGTDRETAHKFRDTPRGVHENIGIKPTIDKMVINSLKEFLEKPLLKEETELREGSSNKSLLDERNIIDE